MLLIKRQAAFRLNEMRGKRMAMPTIHTLTFIHDALSGSKTLYISVPLIMKRMANAPTTVSRGTVSTAIADLAGYGLLQRATRKAPRGSGTQVLYGITATGKALVHLYLEYLAGEHDDKLPL